MTVCVLLLLGVAAARELTGRQDVGAASSALLPHRRIANPLHRSLLKDEELCVTTLERENGSHGAWSRDARAAGDHIPRFDILELLAVAAQMLCVQEFIYWRGCLQASQYGSIHSRL